MLVMDHLLMRVMPKMRCIIGIHGDFASKIGDSTCQLPRHERLISFEYLPPDRADMLRNSQLPKEYSRPYSARILIVVIYPK